MTSQTVEFNPFDPAWRADPYPLFKMLRSEAPVGQVPYIGIHYLTRFDDCELVLRHPQVSVDTRRSALYRQLAEAGALRLPDAVTERRSFLFLDPPDHTRLRGLVAHAFAPRMTARLESRIDGLVAKLLDAADERGSLEVVEDLAYPLTLTMICEVIGIPAADHAKIRRWSKDMAGSNDPMIAPPPEVVERQTAAVAEGSEYLLDLIRARRDDPAEDLVTALLGAEAGGDQLTEAELLSTVILLLAAGFESSASLIGNGVLALLRNRDQFELLRRDPSLARSAVEESLRFDPPVQMTQRIPLEDIEVGGVTLQKETAVLLVLAAANRDEQRYPDGERFDITREDIRHLAFGFGPHFCLGTSLGRAEGAAAFAALAARYPDLHLAGEDGIRRRTDLVMRGLEALPVET
jgi:cytochrome P450